MAGGIINMSSSSPCPICGKPDWCGWAPKKDVVGEYILFCKRNFEQSDVYGMDGNYYVHIGFTAEGCSKYEEANQRKAALDRWKEAKRNEKASSSNRAAKVATPYRREMVEVELIKARDNEYLDKIYRFILDNLVLDDFHRDYLHKEGWSDELIEKNHIKTFAPADWIRKKYKNTFSHNPFRTTLAKRVTEKFGEDALKGVPGAYCNKYGAWDFAGKSGILFPLYDKDGNIYRLRIRMDFTDVAHELIREKGKDPYYMENGYEKYLVPMKGIYTLQNGEKVFEKGAGKYRNFSSYQRDKEEEKKGRIVNIYTDGCEAGNQVGIYFYPERDDRFICFITEGEKKGMFVNENMHVPFISVPGVNSWSKILEGEKGSRIIDYFKENGVTIFVMAFDADKETNSAVLKNEQAAIQALKEEGFTVGIANWDSSLGKGIDDLFANGYQPEYSFA